MSWQQRKNKLYYYRSHWDGRRVTHDYFGAGPAAWAVAKLDAEQRERRKAQADATAALRKASHEADAPLRRLSAASDTLVRAVLLSEGFYRYQRSPWRRRAWAYAQQKNY